MIEETFVTHIGVDESGKGDFFGPLVIAGVMVDEKSAKIFEELRIRDSKKITDGKDKLEYENYSKGQKFEF